MQRIAQALLTFLFAAWPALGSANEISVALEYEIRLGGLHAGAVHLTATLTPERYRIAARTESRGLVDMLVGFRSEARTEGERRLDRVIPKAHQADNKWRGEPRWVRVQYGEDGLNAEVHPPPELDDRDPVPPELQKGTLDPLSAAVRAVLAAEAERPCQDRLDVFDGRRRYALHFEDAQVESSATRCRVRLERIAGMSHEPWLPILEPIEKADLWIERVRPDLPPLPLRLQADTAFGAAQVRLVALNGAPL